MTESALAIVILAAGKGSRMKSNMPKVLHKVAGLPMLGHVIKTAEALSPQKIVIVAAPDHVETFRPYTGAHEIVVQDQQLGTGHAVRCAESALKNFNGDVLVLYGDVPLMNHHILSNFIQDKRKHHAKLSVMGFEPYNPYGFGRLWMANDDLLGIIEQKDLTPEQEHIKKCNTGIMCVDSALLWELLTNLKNNNSQNEYYLTDIAAAVCERKLPRRVFHLDHSMYATGVNSRADLSEAERLFQMNARWDLMLSGVTLQDANSVHFYHDTQIAEDVTIGANVVFGPGVVVESGAEILPFSHLEGCTVKTGARIGPFARIRPGSVIGKNARIGNFVEIKNTQMAEGAKANHLSYIGDASVGTDANIGAGTITCNYDGIKKSKTEIGAGAFIGSNSALIAPVKIGDGAMVAAGSVITKNVEPGALGLARGGQKNIANWAKEFFSKGKS